MNLSAQVNLFNRVSLLDKLLFTKHLSVMLQSGIPLSEAITTIKEQTQNPPFKKILSKVDDDVENGQTLFKTLSKYPKIFDSLFLNLVDVGEQSGNLEKNLNYLSEKLKKDYEFRKKVQAASLYPLIILATAILVGGGISYFVLPKLIELFESLDVKLPLSTKILLFIANTMKDYGIFIFAGAILFIILFKIIIELPKVKPLWQEFLLSLPVVGKFIQNVELTQMSRNLGIMLRSGLPIAHSLKAEQEATSNLIFKGYIDALAKGIEKGKSLEDQLSGGKFKYVPGIFAKMVGVGEKTGKLEDSLLYLGNFFEEEVDDAAKNLSSTLEPILLIAISMVVAFVAFAVITPIYEFTGSIKK